MKIKVLLARQASLREKNVASDSSSWLLTFDIQMSSDFLNFLTNNMRAAFRARSRGVPQMQRGREEKFARRAAAEDAVSCFVWTLKNQPLSKAGTVVIHKQTTTTKKTWSWIIC